MSITMKDAIMFFEGELKVAKKVKYVMEEESKQRHYDYIDALQYALDAMKVYSSLVPQVNLSQKDLLDELNKFMKTTYSLQDVYMFEIDLANNDIDDEFDCFKNDSLESIAKLCLGRSGIFTCNDNKTIKPRIFKSWIEKDPIKRTKLDKPLLTVKAYAFIPRTADTLDLINFVESDVKKTISLSCSVNHRWCSICKADKCNHGKGKFYNGKLCYSELYGILDIYEWSFVENRRY